VHLVFDIFQGIGVAAAVGIRPFLPGLVTGALAAAGVELSFDHTKLHFLQQPVFLAIMVVGAIVLALAERRFSRSGSEPRALTGVFALCALAVGALLAGGAVAHSGHHFWIGLIIGVICAAIGLAASRPLLTRVRGRLGQDSGMLDTLTELGAALAAALSIVAPPIGIILLLALLWLLLAGRGKGDQKYAGLRILR
jgi:uncharacterized membrane protein